MTEKDGDSDRWTQGILSSEEVTEIETAALNNPYNLEPLGLSRQELLKLFNTVIAELVYADVEFGREDLRQCINAGFANKITAYPDLRYGTEMMIKGARSFMAPEDRLGLLDGRQQLFGTFAAAAAAPWYDSPYSPVLNPRLYLKGEGLHFLMVNSKLVAPDGSVDFLGDISIPLNHGKPTLCRVLR